MKIIKNNLLKATLVCLMVFVYFAQNSNAQCRVITIGDSTMAQYDETVNDKLNELRGWVQMLPPFLANSVTLDNFGKCGRSSKSFYYEFWKELRETLQPGDYVFIQFGHNDEKNAGLDSKESNQKGLGTAAWGQYIEYLTKYVQECRNRGAIPVLFTSIVRGSITVDGKLTPESLHNLSNICGNNIQMNYPLAMRALAKELAVPLIDMTLLTQKLVEAYGYEKAKKYIYCSKDNAHLKATGGILFAGLAVKEMYKQGILKQEFILP